MNGLLKQKLKGTDGILRWKERRFSLNADKRELTITDCNDDISDTGAQISDSPTVSAEGAKDPEGGARRSSTKVSLEGARLSAAWDGIDALSGGGFDIIWVSGRVWSLLCDDANRRKSWVDALNASIRDAGRDARGHTHSPVREKRQPSAFRAKQERLVDGITPRMTGVLAKPPRQEGLHGSRSSRITHGPIVSQALARASRMGIAADALNAHPQDSNTSDSSDAEEELSSACDGRGRRLVVSELASASDESAVLEEPSAICSGGASRAEAQRRRLLRRRQQIAESDGLSCASKECPASPVMLASACRYRRRRRGCAGRDVGKADESGGGSQENTSSRGHGGPGSRWGNARKRSEELARASAETWSQFQTLLQRSRESKARFDRAMDGAVQGGADPSKGLEGREVCEGTRKHSSPGTVEAKGNEEGIFDVRAREMTHGDAPVGQEALEAMVDKPHLSWAAPTQTHQPSSAVYRVSGECSSDASKSLENSLSVDDPNVRAPQRSPLATPRCETLTDSQKTNYGSLDMATAEQSRLSAVTDVETSVVLSEQGRDNGRRSTADNSSGRSGGPDVGDEDVRLSRRRQRAPPSSVQVTSTCRNCEAFAFPSRTNDRLPERVRELEDKLGAARLNAESSAQLEKRLREELRVAVTRANVDLKRLEDELAEMKSAAGQHVKTGISLGASECESQSGAKAEERYLERQRLEDALARAAQAEEEREITQRQKRKLDNDLAMEVAERKRVSELLETCSRSERSLRKQQEAADGERNLKARLASMTAELDGVCAERDALADELDKCIARLGDQAREVASALRSRQQVEVTEISSRFELEKEALREELGLDAAERSREGTRVALAAQEKRLRAEAAKAARQAAKASDQKIHKVRAEAQAASEATRKDIEKLRALHAKRVLKLEVLLKEETENLARARREIAVCKATSAGDAGEFQRWTEQQREESDRLLQELARIQKQVDEAVSREASARERERLAMSRMRKIMEEARLERAEGAELRRRLREAVAEVESLRNSQARKARSDVQLQRSVEIAQQEVAMLETERASWHEERRAMETAMDRLARLVYGVRRNMPTDMSVASGADSSTPKPTYQDVFSKEYVRGPQRVAVAKRAQGCSRAACRPMEVNTPRTRSGRHLVASNDTEWRQRGSKSSKRGGRIRHATRQGAHVPTSKPIR